MRRLYRMIFGPECPHKNTDETVRVAKMKVRRALDELDREVLVLMTAALRSSKFERSGNEPRSS